MGTSETEQTMFIETFVTPSGIVSVQLNYILKRSPKQVCECSSCYCLKTGVRTNILFFANYQNFSNQQNCSSYTDVINKMAFMS